MEYVPPIAERETKDLLKIIERPSKWKKEVVDLAREELIARGVSVKKQVNRKRSIIKFKQRTGSIKANATYSMKEKLLIIVFAPLTFVFLSDASFYKGFGYKKMNIEGIICFLTGCLLWVGIFILYLSF